MKYGQQLERASIPEWSLHNLDYNSLKHQIKVHTVRDQATAIAIPGHQDTALQKFEHGLYFELCRQHDRVGMFITSKADEISRRLEHLASQIQRWVAKYSDADDRTLSLRRQRRFAKYERELLRCGEEILALSRFADAQITAFRKILKKYKKWTGSVTLSSRFTENILSNPKSFTQRSFEHLRSRYDEILTDLQATTPDLSEPSSPDIDGQAVAEFPERRRSRQIDCQLPSAAEMDSPIKYWNEYDHGSDAGGFEDDYAIYINPNDKTGFPGFACVNSMLTLPYRKVKKWLKMRQASDEHRPLLSPTQSSSQGYASTALESEEEGFSSSDGYPQLGYATHYALPSISEQKVQRYREKVLKWSTLGCFLFSFALLALDSVLILTGKHKLRVEVDAGVTVGTMISLFCAGSGLGMTLYRRDAPSLSYKVVIWSAFSACCILNGMLLVLVLGNAP
ncbi:hypothetical protein E4U42_004649 [Claviceps africana]|uniref:SPX domain-containing protein n=1 Tax=Claviceps africana TaxID=83212 RepID=A0A8K0NKM9_9HYPO|nr:hypothetical protein E4U42_004649 [Claviceps africana]